MVFLWTFLSLVLSASLFANTNAQRKIIVDTDIGTDIDDTWAISLLLSGRSQAELKQVVGKRSLSPEVEEESIEIMMILTSTDDTKERARVLAKFLTQSKKDHIPIGIGIETPRNSSPVFLSSWAKDFSLDSYKGPVHKAGVEEMARMIIEEYQKNQYKTTILALAPMTNIHWLCQKHPVIDMVELVGMSGAVYTGYANSTKPVPEWNVFYDIPAAQNVYAQRWKKMFTPLDSCGRLQIDGENYNMILKSKNPAIISTLEQYRHWYNICPWSNEGPLPSIPSLRSSVLYDLMASYIFLFHTKCSDTTLCIVIDNKGMTVPSQPVPTSPSQISCVSGNFVIEVLKCDLSFVENLLAINFS